MSARWEIIIAIGLTCKLICFFCLPWIYESPIYLKSKNLFKEADLSITNINKFNEKFSSLNKNNE
jgi:hypothetical protein